MVFKAGCAKSVFDCHHCHPCTVCVLTFDLTLFKQNAFGYTPAYDQRDHGFGPQSINNNAYGRGVSSTARPFYGKK